MTQVTVITSVERRRTWTDDQKLALTFHYVYDFGDYWHHVIKVEKVAPALANFDYPSSSPAPAAARPKTSVASLAMPSI